MTSIIARRPMDPAPEASGSVLADQLFWLSKLDEDLPRAAVPPDFRRTTAVQRTYEGVRFELDADVVRILKSLESTRGVSDTELCLGLLGIVLAKAQREDRLIIGLKMSSVHADADAVVPLLLGCKPQATILSLMQAAAAEIDEMLAHSSAVVLELPRILGAAVQAHRFPLFDIALAVGEPGTTIDLGAFPVDIAFLFEVESGRIRGRALYAAELYERATIERLVSRFPIVAGQIAAQPTLVLKDVDILGAEERQHLLVGLNALDAAFPLHQTFHGLFEAQAERTPREIAVIHPQRQLTYAELNDRANRLAHTLIARGLNKGGFVGILLQRSGDFVVAMLAVFKAGGAYVPLDPTYPRERIRYMLDDSEAALLISSAAIAREYAQVFAECPALRVLLSLDGPLESVCAAGRADLSLVQPEQLAAASPHNPGLALGGSDRAYMIYTSGSTGRPKGAICRHDGALNHLFGELDGIGVRGAFRFLQTAASSSDISVWQFMAPLLYGGATVIADYDVVVDPVLLLAAMREHDVTVAEPVPVVLRALLDHLCELPPAQRELPALRCMMCTGEALAAELVDRWLGLYPGIPIANTYGPTETSDDVTLMVMREPLSRRHTVTPIGRPLPNVRIFVLDRDLRLVPAGVPGEICIAGVAVGEGYWRQPDKTAAAFVPCPFPEVASGSMYRTGDLGRWLPDGSIEFLGRIDQQVKVRGFRIEPGEIEQVMAQHPAVQDAAVVTVDDAAGNRRLIGHFVTHKGTSLSGAELREYLKGRLADHMVPAALVALGALPLTPLGKVDRRALTRIEALKSVQSEAYVAPRNATEATLAAVWSAVIGAGRVGIHDNFFEIGGDSILSIHVVAGLRRHGLQLAPRQLFRHPTIAELAGRLQADPGEAALPMAAAGHAAEQGWDIGRWREQLSTTFPDLDDVYPLSATQRGIYFQSLLAPRSSGAYIEQLAFDLKGPLDADAFAAAWRRVATGDEMLRTAIIRRGAPHPLQVVLRSAALAPSLLDWRDVPAADQRSRLAALVAEERMRGFDLKRPPLCRVTLVRLSDTSWRVLWTYHHLILDGWSEPLLLRSVFQAYEAGGAGEQPVLMPRPRYRDFVVWSESQDLAAAEAYWRQQLGGFGTPASIRDTSPGLTPPSSSEISHGWDDARLTPADLVSLEAMTRRNGLTLGTLIHGAWALLLHRRTGSADVVCGSVASGRQCALPGVESIHGLLAVTQPLRTRTVADAAVSSWLRLLQLQMAEMREHEHTPLALIQQWSDVPAERRPMFDTLVVVGNYAGSDLAGCASTGLVLDQVEYSTQPLFALTLFVTVDDGLSIRLVYDRKRYASQTNLGLMTEFRQLLARIGENPEQRLASLLDAHPLGS